MVSARLDHFTKSSSSSAALPAEGEAERGSDRETTVCVEGELIKSSRVCLTDTEGSLSSNNNSLMKVCVCKGIRAAVLMNHGTHQSCVIDQIPNSRQTEINTAAEAAVM